MKHLMEDIAEINTKFGHPCNSSLTKLSPREAKRCLTLVVEEVVEVLEELFGVENTKFGLKSHTFLAAKFMFLSLAKASSFERQNYDHAKIAHEIVDLIVVLVGTALSFGIPLDRVWDEIKKSNLAKVPEDGEVVRREDGKVLKPDGWVPPDIEGAIKLPTNASWPKSM